MFVAQKIEAGDKAGFYRELLAQAGGLLQGERDAIANAANLSALIHDAVPDLNWTGFYFLKTPSELVLGPFQGKVACVRIPVGKGVCGGAVAKGRSLLVPDVHAFPGHIACDSASRSELVEPSGRLIRAERVAADATMAELLDCRPGAALHRLESLAVVEGVPLSRSVSHFSAERFPGIIDAYAETGSITEALKREGLSDYRRRQTRLTAERVSMKDAVLLSCPSDAIVLISRAVDEDLEGCPVQVIRTKFLADRMELVLENTTTAASR